MKTIKQVLDQQGESVLDKNLWRGAKIAAYQDDIANLLDQDIYACELDWAGEWSFSHITALDHHGARAHEKATILQVLDVLGIPANLEYKLVAANDSGYIPAMQDLLRSEGMTNEDEIQKMIAHIRYMDRQSQGISSEQEMQAEEAIKNKQTLLDGKLVLVALPHSKCATVTDRLFGSYTNLLVLSGDGEANFYGDGKICADLGQKFPWSWNGCSGLGVEGWNAYRGGYPNHEELKTILIDALQ